MNQTDSTLSREQPTEQPGSADQPKQQDRSTEFVAVEGGADTTSAEVLLVTAYGAMWALVFLFIWLTSRRQRQLDTRLHDVETALRRMEGAPGGGSE